MKLLNATSTNPELSRLELSDMKIFNFKNLMFGILLGLIAALILPNIANARSSVSAVNNECNRIAIESDFNFGMVPTSVQYHLSKGGQAGQGGSWARCSGGCDDEHRTQSLDYWHATRQIVD